MQFNSTHKPTTLNLDKSFSDLSPTESFYLLNHEVLLNVRGLNGNNTGSGKPLPANSPACEIDQPGGENYVIGAIRSMLTNELYSLHYNSNGSHYILRTTNNGCEVVYHGCLNFSAEPKHSIEQWRGFMWIEKICNNRDGKQLIWTDGNMETPGQLDVEASIATNFFTTPFFSRCPDPGAYVSMCVPEICGCIQAEWIPLPESEIGLSNFMLDAPFQFAIMHEYYDGRMSILSDRSTTYYQDAKGCFDSESGFARCMKLRVPIGNPMVDKIHIIYTTGLRNENGAMVWYRYDIVEKYKKYNNNQQKWYERDLAELLNYSDSDCSFDYIFCNDKGKETIDPKIVSRVRNPIPRKSQGILPVKDSIGLFNYEDGNCPIDKIQIEKFDITANCDQAEGECETEYSTVTARAIIHNTRDNFNQFVYRQSGDADDPDDKTETAYFGGVNNGFPYTQYIGFGQQFKDTTRDFIAYVEATNYWGEGKQWKSSPGFITRTEVGVLSGMGAVDTRAGISSTIFGGQYYFQEFKIRVKKGTRGFIRLTSHNSVDGSGSSQDKSTYVVGSIPNIIAYSGTMNIFTILEDKQKELYFDTCDGDVALDRAFIIADNAVGGDNTAYSGYITDANGFPVEGAEIYKQGVDRVSITDHNGFYNFYSDVQGMTAQIRVETSCGAFGAIQTMSMQGTEGAHQAHDETITSTNYRDDYYLIVKEKVEDCDGIGVAGIKIAVSGSKYETTDSGGIATFHLRNYSTRDRSIRTIVMDGGGCIAKDCDGNCSPCLDTYTSFTPVCYYPKSEITMPDMVINRASALDQNKGLKSGGRYGFGIVAEADCGRLSAVYHTKYLDIPKVQAKNSLNFCSLSYNGNGISLPGFKCLKIVRTINLNPYELQWKVDKIEKTTDNKIKLTIQSLNDYNNRYFFQTNTVYQWLKNDRVEFIMNGDGNILTTAANGLLNYLTISPYNDELISGVTDDTNYFNQLLITDDGKLDNITEGAIIELQRPKASTTENIYYQICGTLLINEDGSLVNDAGTFETFDTFLVNRNIGSFSGTFEHHSPSDFWGDHVSDVGKAFVENKYENERRYGRNISINSPTQFNYFGDLVKRFDAPGQGDIIAMNIKDGKIIAAICEYDNFLAESADDLVRVGGDGIIRALPPDAIISDAQPKIYGEFGCQYDHIGSIFFGDGYFQFVDVSRNARVVHDYSVAKDVAEGRVQTYYRVRCQDIQLYNRNTTDPLDKFRFATAYNNASGMIYQTIKRLRDNGYNNEIKPFQINNDTIAFHPILNEWFGFVSFTGEFYSNIERYDDESVAFVSFLNGVPYIHPVISSEFNRFFGVPVDELMAVTLNKFTDKMVLPLAIEVQSDMMWFSPEVTTDKPNFISELPPKRWKRTNRKWNCAFLNNKNSRAGLYGNNGGVPDDSRGFHVNILLKRDNTIDNEYNSINNQKRVQYNETGDIMIKCQIIESAGMTANL